jgi:hypothetical protein
MTDEILDDEKNEHKPKRRKNGTFARGESGNRLGRPSGSTNKINKQKIVTAFNKDLLKTLHKILDLGDKAAEDGQIASALKAYSFYAEKGLQVLAQQDKLVAEMEKLRKKEEVDNTETTPELEEAIFEFTSFNGTDN